MATHISGTAKKAAQNLTYTQRKALRRISRGQTISGTMSRDPMVHSFYACSVKPMSQRPLTVVDWCDWEAEARSARPQITDWGREVFAALEDLA